MRSTNNNDNHHHDDVSVADYIVKFAKHVGFIYCEYIKIYKTNITLLKIFFWAEPSKCLSLISQA